MIAAVLMRQYAAFTLPRPAELVVAFWFFAGLLTATVGMGKTTATNAMVLSGGKLAGGKLAGGKLVPPCHIGGKLVPPCHISSTMPSAAGLKKWLSS